jgi:hypothetical protein
MFNTAILVLLYNKTLKESETLNTLLNSDVHYPDCKIVIWNNGPKALQDKDVSHFCSLGYEVSIEESLDNKALSVIYNAFISETDAEKYIFLDDDSCLNDEYIKASSEVNGKNVAMPIIKSDLGIESPRIDGVPYSFGMDVGLKNKVITIGSGLVVGIDIIYQLQEKYQSVFDECFYLYGVDTTFCLRLFNCKLTPDIQIIKGFSHSLSRLESEGDSIKKFRKLERTYDVGLRLRHYYPLLKQVYLLIKYTYIHVLNKLGKKDTSLLYGHFLKAFIVGKHYRNYLK